MHPDLRTALHQEIQALTKQDRFRSCPPLSGAGLREVSLPDRPSLLSFCSNDYLGLAGHPQVVGAAASLLGQATFGSGASRLVSGDHPEHRDLEQTLSRFIGLPSTLLFPSGYHANLGVITALAGPNDLILSDAANHASLIDGCRLSRARIQIYPHKDCAAVRSHLAQSPSPYRRRFILTESLFSMDGDTAPLADLAELAHQARASLIVDEAHSLGALGPAGRGWAREQGVVPDALIGTLGKAFGASGGFVSGVPELRATLVNRARTFIYTTAPPRPSAAAARAAVEIAGGTEGDQRRDILHRHIRRVREAIAPESLSAPISPILPLLFGADQAALQASRTLQSAGLFVQAIRPPTVPEGTARLRITLSAHHDDRDIARLIAALTPLLAAPPT